MTFKPLENHLVCEKIESIKQDLSGIAVPNEVEQISIYEVKDINVSKDSFVKIGDKIICNSTGINLYDNLFLFKLENVAGVIENL